MDLNWISPLAMKHLKLIVVFTKSLKLDIGILKLDSEEIFLVSVYIIAKLNSLWSLELLDNTQIPQQYIWKTFFSFFLVHNKTYLSINFWFSTNKRCYIYSRW